MGLLAADNLALLFHRRVAADKHRTAYLRKVGGVWRSVTWREVEDRVYGIARALEQEGIVRGDRVAILSQTRPEWFLVDLALQSLGAVTVPLYAAIPAHDVFEILRGSRARAVFLEDNAQSIKFASLPERAPVLKFKVSFERVADAQTPSLDEWAASKSSAQPELPGEREAWRARAQTFAPNDEASVVYTSGTMGESRGVILSHQNFLSTLSNVGTALQLSQSDLSLLFLPVAHIIGRMEMWMSVATGLTNAYASSLSNLTDDMAELRPTMLVAVPRIFEKMRSAIRNRFEVALAGSYAQPFSWALEVGVRRSRSVRAGRAVPLATRVQYAAAERIYFQRIRDKLGGRLRVCFCGGAPLSTDLAEFFHACGILLLEGYGLTESTGPAVVNRPGAFRFGTVGRPLPDVELRLAEDGEIALRGPTLAARYETANGAEGAETPAPSTAGKPAPLGAEIPAPLGAAESDGRWVDGWFYTGDVGQLDADGFLSVTDRKRDIIVTSGAKNVAPLKVERCFQNDDLFAHTLVVGEGRPRLAVLLTLNLPVARRLATDLGLAELPLEQILENEKFHRALRTRLAAINEALPDFERVRHYRVLPRDFSVEAGELTPSLKVRRRFCLAKYSRVIEEMYKSGRKL